MRGDASRGVLKVWLYAVASVLLGSWMTPLVYNAGKALAEVSGTKQTNGPLEWLAEICRKAEFPGFFEATLLLAAFILFLPFLEWLRGGAEKGSSAPWSLRGSAAHCSANPGQALIKNPNGFRQMATGFLCVTLLFGLFAGVLHFAGVFSWSTSGWSPLKSLFGTLAAAFALSIVMEFFFRGLVLGIFLRAMPVPAALVLVTVLFAFIVALSPPEGMTVPDPDASGVGFEMLGKVVSRFSDPTAIIVQMFPLLALGGVLAYARWRTASLRLPIGIHSGWIFTDLLMSRLTIRADATDTFLWMKSASPLMQGIVPLIGIILAGILTLHLSVTHDPADRAA